MPKLRHGSLFSGIGGFDLAAEWMGWENVFHCEIDEYNRNILKKHFPNAISYKDVHDIYRYTHEMVDIYEDGEVMWCERHDMDFADCDCVGCSQFDDEIGKIDILTGGFPCVDITSAKNAKEKPKGLDGEKSKLWIEYERIISQIRPRYAVVENSSNLNFRGLYRIIGDFAALRYDCVWFTLPATIVGAPHIRQRTYIVAHANESGLERNVSKELANQIQRRFNSDACRSTWWDTKPRLDRVVNGLPARVDHKRQRLSALGNAVVPQVVYQIFKTIDEYDRSTDPAASDH